TRGRAELQAMVTGQGQAANLDSFRIAASREVIERSQASLFRMYHRHRVSSRKKTFHQIRQGQGDSVYFGWIGLGNDAYVLRICRRSRKTRLEGRMHGETSSFSTRKT